MTNPESGAAQFDFGVIFRQTFRVFATRLWTMLVLGVLFRGAPELLTLLAQKGLGVEPVHRAVRQGLDMAYWRASGLRELIDFGASGLYGVGQAAATGVVASVLGYRSSGSSAKIVAYAGPLAFVTSMITTAIVAGGVLLFIVPGMIAMTMFYVAVPALTSEKLGVLGALRQSRVLSKGNRWSVFGIAFAFGLIHFAIAYVVDRFGIGDVYSRTYASIAIRVVSNSIVDAFTISIPAVVYFELLRIKKGLSPTHAADVFD